MFKSRMLDAIKQSRYIPPIWLAILIAIGFVYVGRFAGMFGMFPIGLLVFCSVRQIPLAAKQHLWNFSVTIVYFLNYLLSFLSLLLSFSGFDIVRSVLFLV